MEEGDEEFDPETIGRLVAQIERLILICTSPLVFEELLFTSRKLQHIFYVREDHDDFLWMEMIEQAVVENNISPDLKTVQVGLSFLGLCGNDCEDTSLDVVRLYLEERFS